MVLSLYTLATFPLSVIMALLINELRGKRFQKTVQMVTYAPHFIHRSHLLYDYAVHEPVHGPYQ